MKPIPIFDTTSENPQAWVPLFVTVEDAKNALLTCAKECATSHIHSIVPQYKQINAAIGVYDEATRQQITSTINAVRDQCHAYEDQINAAATFMELYEIDFVY